MDGDKHRALFGVDNIYLESSILLSKPQRVTCRRSITGRTIAKYDLQQVASKVSIIDASKEEGVACVGSALNHQNTYG